MPLKSRLQVLIKIVKFLQLSPFKQKTFFLRYEIKYTTYKFSFKQGAVNSDHKFDLDFGEHMRSILVPIWGEFFQGFTQG